MDSWEAQFREVQSPCHSVDIIAKRQGEITFGVCTQCQAPVIRANPVTGHHEWLDGQDVNTKKSLRPVPR